LRGAPWEKGGHRYVPELPLFKVVVHSLVAPGNNGRRSVGVPGGQVLAVWSALRWWVAWLAACIPNYSIMTTCWLPPDGPSVFVLIPPSSLLLYLPPKINENQTQEEGKRRETRKVRAKPTECSKTHLSLHSPATSASVSFHASAVALCCPRYVLVTLSTVCRKRSPSV